MNILALAGDAGGARALIPVIRRLRSMPEVTEACRAYAVATQIWEAAGLAPADVAPVALSGVERVILGTSIADEPWELRYIQRARAASVPTVSVMESWVHYRERFTDSQGTFILPEKIAVMDERARGEMVGAGFPAECLVVTGQPAFDALAPYREPAVQQRSRDRLQRWDHGLARPLYLLYVSQPLSQLAANRGLGYHEADVLPMVIDALECVLERRAVSAVLLVKLHPRETSAAAPRPRSGSRRLAVTVVPDGEMERLELAAGSDLVIGMNSILLMEACLLKRPVVSFQPNLQVDDVLPSNRHGWSRAVYRQDELERALEEELFDAGAREARRRTLEAIQPPEGATERVAELLMAQERIRC